MRLNPMEKSKRANQWRRKAALAKASAKGAQKEKERAAVVSRRWLEMAACASSVVTVSGQAARSMLLLAGG